MFDRPDVRGLGPALKKKKYEIPGFGLTKPSWDWDCVN
jgi:hypothetical protein